MKLLKSPYIPATDKQREEMLKSIDLASIEELFLSIPKELRLEDDLKLPGPLSEYELKKELLNLTQKNFDATWNTSFLGAGIYK